jgi:osmoprotectant transport system permease protein
MHAIAFPFFFATFWSDHSAELRLRFLEHVELTFLAVSLSSTLAALVVFLTWRRPLARRAVEIFCNLTQTLPSLALLAFLIPLFGIGWPPALAALTIYALLPLVRNAYSALAGTPVELLEAGRTLGLSESQLFFHAHLPHGLPTMIAGLRLATVWSVGTATLSAYVGAGGLGDFITRGITFMDTRLLLLGAVPAALLALSLDTLLAWSERRAQRWKTG